MNISILVVLLKIIGGLFAFLAALFTFLSVAQNERHEKTQDWFRKRWQGVDSSRWLRMPERVIAAVIEGRESLVRRYKRLDEDLLFGKLQLIAVPLFVVGILINLGPIEAVIALIMALPALWIGIGITFGKSAVISALFRIIPDLLLGLLIIVPPLGTAVIWTAYALRAELIYALFGLIIALPCFLCLTLGPVGIAEKLFKTNSISKETDVFGIAIGLSFSVTLISFFLGNLIDPSAHVPQTLQMLAANVFFDGVTMVVTFALLDWAVKKTSMLRIPAAIVFDVVVAATLACASLYFGLRLSENHLSPQQVFFVLIGKAPSGSGVELGPYFWAMHTTFLPTLFYLTVILIAWLGKTLLIPIRWFFGKGHEHKNPLKLTAALCTLLAAFFALSGMAVDAAGKRVEEPEDATGQVVSEAPSISYLTRVDMVLMGPSEPLKVPLTLGVEGGEIREG